MGQNLCPYLYMDVNFCNFKKSPKSTQQIYIGPRVFNFTTTQEGEGTPSPTNVRSLVPGFSFERDDHSIVNVYGGSLDIVNSLMTITYVKDTLGNMAWSKSGVRFFTTLTYAKPFANGDVSTSKCECYLTTTNNAQNSSTNPIDLSIAMSPTSRLYVRDSNITGTDTPATVHSDIVVVYELATPQNIQLSASELQRCCEQLHVPYPVPPVADNYTIYDCTLHENTDIINPVIKLKTDSAVDVLQWNYCYIPTFSRYYFIQKIEWNMGTWLVYLTEDVLASNKTAIGSSTQYVIRAASQYDNLIIDTKYTTKTEPQYSSFGAIGSKTLFGTYTDPWYIVGVIGGIVGLDASIRGAVYNGSVVYYAMQKTQFQYLMEILLDVQNFYIPTGEISENLQKQLINPLQYIHSIRLIPFQPEFATANPVTYVNLGFNTFTIPTGANIYICKMYDVTDRAHVDNGCVALNQVSIQAEVHPDYDNKGPWVMSSPYTKYILNAQPFGRFEIPSGIVTAGVIRTVDGHKYIQIDLDCYFDATTGICTLKATVDGGGVFLYQTQDMTVAVPYHQSVQDYMGFRQANRDIENMQYNAVRGFVGSILNLDLGDAMNVAEDTRQKAMTAIDNATEANQVTISGNGTVGAVYSFHNYFCSPSVDAYYTLFADEYNTDFGRPLCKPKVINTLSGYVQCQNADFKSAALADENRRIEAYMNGGFFYE